MRQLDLFRDCRQPPAHVPAPPRAARRDDAERALDLALHVAPDPRRVYALAVSHGFDACVGRYYWLARGTVGRLISQGRAMVVGARSPKARRPLDDAQEAEVVAAALELGGVAYAAQACRIPESLVRTILRERGVDYPRASGRRQDAAAARVRVAEYIARRAA